MTPAESVINKLQADTYVSAWATGGVLDRDPRRTGINSTPDAFSKDEMAEILPTISVTPSVTTRPMSITAPPNAMDEYVNIRIFHSINTGAMTNVTELMKRLRELLHHKPLDVYDTSKGYSVWANDLGPLNTEQFADTIYAESTFYVTSLF